MYLIYVETVTKAYSAMMKITFGQGSVTAVLGLLLIIKVKISRLSAHPQVNTD
jgi:hypothetical protein